MAAPHHAERALVTIESVLGQAPRLLGAARLGRHLQALNQVVDLALQVVGDLKP
jgi:hypothetical protein